MSDCVKMATFSWPFLYSSTSRSEEHNKDRRILHSINILDALCGLKISSEIVQEPTSPKLWINEKKKKTFNNRLSAKRKRRTSEIMFWSMGIIIVITQLAECQSSHACCSPPLGTLCRVFSSAWKGQRVGRWRRVSIKTPPAQPLSDPYQIIYRLTMMDGRKSTAQINKRGADKHKEWLLLTDMTGDGMEI